MHVPVLNELVIIFLISIVVNTICSKIRLPATVGFLLTGILCGPSLLGIISDVHNLDILAELGVALLLFTIGMELSGDALARLKKPVFLGGSIQIGLTILCTLGIYTVFRDNNIALGIFIGCLVALSSSAIVLRLLQEKGTIATPSGKLSLAILVFQDIMVAPMMLVIPLLGGTITPDPLVALWACIKVLLVLGGVFLFAQFGLNRFMEAVVRTRVRELLLLTTLGLCMGLASLTAWLGLSLSLGAFLAGLFLARSEYSMSVVSGVLPYRDVFMSIFFISVGMLLNIDYLVGHWPMVLGSTLIFIILKALLILPAVLIQKYPLRTAIITALTLAQVGEFSFILANSGVDAGLLSPMQYQAFLAMIIITMMLIPALMHFSPSIANYFAHHDHHKKCKKGTTIKATAGQVEQQELDANADTNAHTHVTEQLENHLIIVGFGISGQHLARAAKKCKIPYVILEMNPDTGNRFSDTEPIHYGDASQPAVLEHLGIHEAKALAIVISDPTAVQATVAEAINLNPQLQIIARTRFVTQVTTLQNLGAMDVGAEEFETSLEVFTRVLHHYLIPQQDIDAITKAVRKENDDKLRATSQQTGDLAILMEQLPDVGTVAIRLEKDAQLCNTSLLDSELRQTHGVIVVAINQQGTFVPTPDASLILRANDVVYLFGSQDKLHDAMRMFKTKK